MAVDQPNSPRPKRGRRLLAVGGIALALGLLALALSDLVIPARDGVLGYSRVLAPYLALLLVPLGLLALWLRGPARSLLGAMVILGLALAVVRFAPVLPPDREPLDVIVAHAPPPTMGILRTGPRFDPTNRDIGLRRLRERVERGITAGRDVVLIGDLNVTDRELGYQDVAGGLTDSHRVAGSGWGHTWRPPRLAGLRFGLLRIDMVLLGPGLDVVESAPDCTPRGTDHCLLDVSLLRSETTHD